MFLESEVVPSMSTDSDITEVLPSAQIPAHEENEDRQAVSFELDEYHSSSESSDSEVRSAKKKKKNKSGKKRVGKAKKKIGQRSDEMGEESALFTVFNSVLPGDTEPHPPPELACQKKGKEKIGLTVRGIKGKNVYIKEWEQKLLLSTHKNKPNMYLTRLLDHLVGKEGLHFFLQRRAERAEMAEKQAASERHISQRHTQTSILALLTTEFLFILERNEL